MWKLLAILSLLAPATEGETFTLSGTVKMEPPFPRQAVNKAMAADPKCAALCPGPVLRDDFVVDAAGRVQWSFVYIKGVKGKFPVPEAPLLLDQVGCTYTPHVFGIRVDQPLDIRNSDPTMHNVNCTAMNNRQFNFAQGAQGQVNQVTFKQAEMAVPLQCNLHPWMRATAHVMDHPFFAVTDAAGKFTIQGLPPGKYTLVAWHEKFEEVIQAIEVKADLTVDVTLKNKRAP